MADQKVSDLPSLNGANVDPADLLYIVDSSAGTAGSKKITIGQFQLAPTSAATADAVAYYDGSKVLTSGSGLTFDGTNLGVGTSSPATILHTVKTSAGAATVGAFLQNADNTAGTEVRLAFAANNSVLSSDRYGWIGYVNTGGFNGGALTFATTPGGTPATEMMRLDSSGNLGIGTSSPGAKLDVAGTIVGLSTAANTIALRANATAGYVSNLSFFRGGYAEWFIGSPSNSTGLLISVSDSTHAAPAMTFTAANLVGIGTTTPGVILDVQQATNDATIQVKTTAGAGAWLQTYDSTDFYSGVRHVGNNGAQRWISGMSNGNAAYCISASSDGSTNRFFTLDTNGNLIQQVNSTAPTLGTNSTMSFELTSNTSLKIVVRGTDGVTRSATLTLS